MNFLVLLLVLWVEKFSAWRQRVQHDSPWLALLSKVQGRPVWLQLSVLLLLPLLLVGVLLLLLESVAYGWLALPLHLLVLIYSLGRGDLQAALGPFRDSWRRGDSEAAYLVAQRDLGIEAESAEQLLQHVQGHQVWQAYQSFFAPIFWYALLGPLAALAYRLLALLQEHTANTELGEAAKQIRHAFDWLTVRVLAASFALVGNFGAVTQRLLSDLLSWDTGAAQLVSNTAVAACELPAPELGEVGISSLDSLWQLLVRSAVLWYAVFALWTLFL
ncbi:regulatory signaling modulator protein AmpE [Pseudomonas sp. 5P_3.1_Bac2]|uniref:regulatory signaling modulator protein AmpE n=1 Tax=Pseudomonas sp. 5P_3.1_Bac2 TaxID=2971617 RepID=UPI0021C8AFA8|nr:regulatory signaling modulator protein AmpE [Pseudomonas sp. 5P_3.1_Bac2]MCU1718115.1 regulatory signaling modulator protein AmpE [Pseudomonas sp. 5P_3.1_Bac2]